MPARHSRSDAKREVQQRQREWLQQIITTTGDKPSIIASNSGVSDSTLTRLLNNPAYRHTLTQVTIDAIKATYKVPGPEELAGRGMLVGFGEAERLERKEMQSVAGALVGTKAVEIWRLRTEALVAAGYLPGDLLMVDATVEPKPQDLVCARVTDWARGAEQTLFRIFDPPFLVAAAADRTAFKPLLIDNERVKLSGVVVESYRPHRLSATR